MIHKKSRTKTNSWVKAYSFIYVDLLNSQGHRSIKGVGEYSMNRECKNGATIVKSKRIQRKRPKIRIFFRIDSIFENKGKVGNSLRTLEREN
ncbi:unnamed protein product [Lactuca virosa]|uniref:Uncharacterized protein n=1 Tax=Lactuca virosa TaxID=75947 RepID=A0AAU9PV72_9ASTR|nr:unnamed protein product [Lactuca virosa]